MGIRNSKAFPAREGKAAPKSFCQAGPMDVAAEALPAMDFSGGFLRHCAYRHRAVTALD